MYFVIKISHVLLLLKILKTAFTTHIIIDTFCSINKCPSFVFFNFLHQLFQVRCYKAFVYDCSTYSSNSSSHEYGPEQQSSNNDDDSLSLWRNQYVCTFDHVCLSVCLQAAVWQALNHYAYLDAVFLAERLYAEGTTQLSEHCVLTSHLGPVPQPVTRVISIVKINPGFSSPTVYSQMNLPPVCVHIPLLAINNKNINNTYDFYSAF